MRASGLRNERTNRTKYIYLKPLCWAQEISKRIIPLKTQRSSTVCIHSGPLASATGPCPLVNRFPAQLFHNYSLFCTIKRFHLPTNKNLILAYLKITRKKKNNYTKHGVTNYFKSHISTRTQKKIQKCEFNENNDHINITVSSLVTFLFVLHVLFTFTKIKLKT